jgi:hypothetical protein
MPIIKIIGACNSASCAFCGSPKPLPLITSSSVNSEDPVVLLIPISIFLCDHFNGNGRGSLRAIVFQATHLLGAAPATTEFFRFLF